MRNLFSKKNLLVLLGILLLILAVMWYFQIYKEAGFFTALFAIVTTLSISKNYRTIESVNSVLDHLSDRLNSLK